MITTSGSPWPTCGTPARIVWECAGSPEQASCSEADGSPCIVCAEPAERGMPYSKWQGSNFTDQNKLAHPAGEFVCEPCVYAHSWVCPPTWKQCRLCGTGLREADPDVCPKCREEPHDGKPRRGPCLRMFTVCWDDEGGLRVWNKADKPAIFAWLRDPKLGAWFASIADAGKKHTLPRARINHSWPGIVRFEEEDAVIGDLALADAMADLLTDGGTKLEIETRRWRVNSMLRSEAAVLAFEDRWGRLRGGSWFRLALWLAQRDEDEFKRRERERKEQAGRAGAGRGPGGGRARGVPEGRGVEPQALGSASVEAGSGGPDIADGRRAADEVLPHAEAGVPGQGTLFDLR